MEGEDAEPVVAQENFHQICYSRPGTWKNPAIGENVSRSLRQKRHVLLKHQAHVVFVIIFDKWGCPSVVCLSALCPLLEFDSVLDIPGCEHSELQRQLSVAVSVGLIAHRKVARRSSSGL